MEILTYSPSVEAYVEVYTGPGAVEYVDVSADIVSCTVGRNQGGESTFSLTLQNVGGKYNGRFTPMDRIAIYATKVERLPMLTGYVTTCDAYQLYPTDFSMSGKCSLYAVEKLYWDPALFASYRLLHSQQSENDEWGGYAQTIYDLMCNVGGWSADDFAVGDIPQAVMDWAREVYEARAADTAQVQSMAREFYEILQTHGPKAAASSASPAAGGASGGEVAASGDQPISGTGGGAFLTGVDFTMKERDFVKLWGDRIDAWYRNKWPGSPLEGHGSVYARAAYKAKFEPRFLPAVTGAEQSGGLVESGLNGNYYGWAVYDSGMGELATVANGIDAWIYYLLSDEAVFAGKPLYQQSWDVIAASWASSSAWAGRVMGFMQEI